MAADTLGVVSLHVLRACPPLWDVGDLDRRQDRRGVVLRPRRSSRHRPRRADAAALSAPSAVPLGDTTGGVAAVTMTPAEAKAIVDKWKLDNESVYRISVALAWEVARTLRQALAEAEQKIEEGGIAASAVTLGLWERACAERDAALRRVEALEKALRPFGKVASDYAAAEERRSAAHRDEGRPFGPPLSDGHRISVALGECREALAALDGEPG